MKSYEVVGYVGDGGMWCTECAPLPDYGDPGASGWKSPCCRARGVGNNDGTYSCEECDKEYEFDFAPAFASDAECGTDYCGQCELCLVCDEAPEAHMTDEDEDEDEGEGGDGGEEE